MFEDVRGEIERRKLITQYKRYQEYNIKKIESLHKELEEEMKSLDSNRKYVVKLEAERKA